MGPRDDAATLCRKVLNANALAIQNSLETLEPAQVERAVRLLARASRIEFIGFGGSAPVAMDAYHKFFRLGIPCGWQDDPHMQAMAASLMRPRCVVVAISHSGSSKDIVETLEIAEKNGSRHHRDRESPQVAGGDHCGHRALRPVSRDGVQAGADVLPHCAPVRHRCLGRGRGAAAERGLRRERPENPEGAGQQEVLSAADRNYGDVCRSPGPPLRRLAPRRCRLALTPGPPPQTGGLRAGDGLARGRGVFGAAPGTWRYAAHEYASRFRP